MPTESSHDLINNSLNDLVNYLKAQLFHSMKSFKEFLEPIDILFNRKIEIFESLQIEPIMLISIFLFLFILIFCYISPFDTFYTIARSLTPSLIFIQFCFLISIYAKISNENNLSLIPISDIFITSFYFRCIVVLNVITLFLYSFRLSSVRIKHGIYTYIFNFIIISLLAFYFVENDDVYFFIFPVLIFDYFIFLLQGFLGAKADIRRHENFKELENAKKSKGEADKKIQDGLKSSREGSDSARNAMIKDSEVYLNN